MHELYASNQIKQLDRLLGLTDDHSKCVYCGDLATCWDHVVPHGFINVGATRYYNSGVAPSCQECNSLLSSQLFESLDMRLDWIAAKVRSRYKKLISSPDWEDSEIEELGPNLRRQMQKQIMSKLWIAGRIRYLDRGSFELWADLVKIDAIRSGTHK